MKITAIAFGTRGDVQPILALTKGLKEIGHHIRIIAGLNFKSWIEQHGIEAIGASVDVQALMLSELGKEWVEVGNQPLKQLRLMREITQCYGPSMVKDAWDACQDAEAVLSSFTSDVYAVSIAEKLSIPHISTLLQPALIATRSGPAVSQAPFPNRDSIWNLLFSKVLIEPFRWKIFGGINNDLRRQVLGLPPLTRSECLECLRRIPTVQGFSRHVVPHPTDWPAHINTTGYWFLNEEKSWQPPRELLSFIESGEPPVFIGFGSMTGKDPGLIIKKIISALQIQKTRAILQTSWSGVYADQLPPNIFQIKGAPHSWLFPRMSAVVHHGGAGTTAEGLRAGVPTIVVPHMAEQPFWGARVAALGVGPKPIPRDKLDPENLARAIDIAKNNPEIYKRVKLIFYSC